MTKSIELPGIYGKDRVLLLDDEDYDKVVGKVCYFDKRGYAYIVVEGDKFLLHRYLLGIHGNRLPLVDHWDGNKGNNQRANLRRCTNSQNQANTKSWGGRKSKGAYFFQGKWVARIMVNGTRIFLGRFLTKNEALQRYDEASKLYFGEFAYTEKNG